jgi:hypothetical protein
MLRSRPPAGCLRREAGGIGRGPAGWRGHAGRVTPLSGRGVAGAGPATAEGGFWGVKHSGCWARIHAQDVPAAGDVWGGHWLLQQAVRKRD